MNENINENRVRLFKFSDYKSFLRAYSQNLPNGGRGFFSKLASFCHVHPTFISQVINGSKDFSLEQGILVAEFFEFSQIEQDLWLALIGKSKAGSDKLVKYYEKQCQILANRFFAVETYVSGAKKLEKKHQALYYSDWKYIAIWLLCGIDEYRNVEDISRALVVPIETCQIVLNELFEMDLISQDQNGLHMTTTKTHLDRHDPLVYRHHVNWRNKAIALIENMTLQDLSFTGPHTISKNDFAEVRQKILDLISFISEKVKTTEPEIMVCFNIDYLDMKLR